MFLPLLSLSRLLLAVMLSSGFSNLLSYNKSLDASGGSVFRNLRGAAEVVLIRAAASTQPLCFSSLAFIAKGTASAGA
jgi:hypothetical protein